MTEMMDYLKSEFKESVDNLTKDVEATPHESLDKAHGESSRCAYDYLYEVAVINRRVAFRMRGDDPGPMPWEFGKEWLKAPSEYRSKAKATEYLNSVADEVVAAAGDDPMRKVKVGENTQSVYQLMSFAAMHTMYHDAQVNFIQEIAGDMEVHW